MTRVKDVGRLDTISGRVASDYVDTRVDFGPPGTCSMSNTYYGILPDGTEEKIDVFTNEKIEDPRYYLRFMIMAIEEERKELETS